MMKKRKKLNALLRKALFVITKAIDKLSTSILNFYFLLETDNRKLEAIKRQRTF
jgi:hypothetical protein